MSEVKLSVSMDVSQAEAAAAALPDSIDRKLRSKKRGDFTQGYTDISAKGTKFIDPKDAMARTANDLKMAQEAEKKKQQAVNETSSDSKKWLKDFGAELGGTLMRTVAPAAIAMKAIEIGWGNVIEKVQSIWGAYEAKITAGVDPQQVRALELYANVGTANNDQVRAMAIRAQAVANANAAGGQGANTKGFEYFEMTDYKRYREEGLPIGELLIAMTKRFKKEGGSEKYRMAAESILGEDWNTLKPLLALGARQKNAGDLMTRMEAPLTNMDQYMYAKKLKLEAMKMTPGEAMGGLGMSNLPQMLSNVTSLQAMGGGDVLSAISRGPQERMVTELEQINANTSKTAIKAGEPSPAVLR
jgi:hypothetical protein